jgi:RNA polymerase sigma-70 factor (ECF subfamily)
MSDAPVGRCEVPRSDQNETFRRLYEAHGPVILNFLIRFTGGDRHRAEDILQETLLRAWRHPEAREATGEWSLPWLFTVARRIAIDHKRAAMVRPDELNDERLDERPELDDPFERLVDDDAVRAALASMPARLRDVLIEIYFRDHSVAEAAETLGVPHGTIKSRTFYGLRVLRDTLIERGFIKPPDE